MTLILFEKCPFVPNELSKAHMKITGTIQFEDENGDFSKIMAIALSPDNLLNMEYDEIKEHENSIRVEFKEISSLIASMDDFFMNAKIAEELYKIHKSIKSDKKLKFL